MKATVSILALVVLHPAGLAIHPTATAMPAQSRSGFHVREAFADREDGWNEHGAELWFGRDAFRLDVWNDGGEDTTRGSMIIPPGDRTHLLFVRHPQRTYYACPLAGLAEAGDAFKIISWPLGDDVGSIVVTPTDEIRPVGRWETSGVDLRHAGPDEIVEQDPTDPRRRSRRQVRREIGTVWFANQTGIQLGEVRAELRTAIRPYGPSFILHSMWLLLVYGLDETLIEGLPPGIPVALEIETNGQPAANSELRSIERMTLPAALFEVPADYVSTGCPVGGISGTGLIGLAP